MPLPLSALQTDITSVDTRPPTPSIAPNGHRCVLKKWDSSESGNTAGLFLLRLTFETCEPIIDTKGETHKPGWLLNTRLTLPGGPCADSQNMSADEQKALRERQFASLIDALRGSEAMPRPQPTDELFDSFLDKQCMLVYKKSKDDSFGETDCGSYRLVPQPKS